MTFRSFLYWLARFLGDVNAIQKGRIVPRISNRIVGRLSARILSRIWR